MIAWLLLGCVGLGELGGTGVGESPAVESPASGEGPAVVEAAWPATAVRTLEKGATPAGVLLLDAGHGAPGNPGNTGWACESEGDVMRRLADGLAPLLRADGLAVTLTRPDATLVDYDRRMEMAKAATWLVSLHSDSRAGDGPVLHPTTGCVVATGAPGFAVLWSDEGDAGLAGARLALARAVARRMAEAGFGAYPGLDYGGLYEADEVPGVFVDRHDPRQRIRFLRRPKIPSVIVETHQAWDPIEAARWEEPATREAFARALTLALADVATPP